jgi:hypothetical protein
MRTTFGKWKAEKRASENVNQFFNSFWISRRGEQEKRTPCGALRRDFWKGKM